MNTHLGGESNNLQQHYLQTWTTLNLKADTMLSQKIKSYAMCSDTNREQRNKIEIEIGIEIHVPASFFLIVMRILDWFAMRRSGVVIKCGLPVLSAFASIRNVCHSASLNIITSPINSFFSLVRFNEPADQ